MTVLYRKSSPSGAKVSAREPPVPNWASVLFSPFHRLGWVAGPSALLACSRSSLTPLAAGSMLVSVEAFATTRISKWHSPLTTPAPCVAVAVAAACCGCVSRSNRKLRILSYERVIHPQPAPAAGSLVLGIKPGNDADGHLPTKSRRGREHEHHNGITHPTHP